MDKEEKPLMDENKDLVNDAEKDLLSVEKKETTVKHISMKKSLIIVSTAIVLIAAIIVGVLFFGKKGKDTDENVKVLYDYELNDIKSINVDNKVSNDNFTLTSFMNGATQAWNIEGQNYDDVNQNKVTYIAQICRHLETKYILEEHSNLSEYGLDDPRSVVTVTYSDGTSVNVKVGNVYGSNEGTYVLLNDEDVVYVVSVYAGNYLTFSMADLMNLPSLSQTGLSAQTVYFIDKDRKETVLSYIPGELSRAEEWYLIKPTVCGTNSENVDALFENIGNLALTSYYCAEAGEDISKFGFDKPYCEVQSYDADGKLLDHFVVGSMVEDKKDTFYCSLLTGEDETFEKSPVYTVKADQIAYIQPDVVQIADPYLLSLNVYWLRKGSFVIDGEKYELTIDREYRYDDDGNVVLDEDGVESTTNTYYINGQKIDEKQFKTFYSKVLFLTIEGITDKDTAKGEELFSYSLDVSIPITDSKTNEKYVRDDTYSGTYYKISDTYAVFKNNQSDDAVFTVRLRAIDSVKEAIKLLMEGKMPTA